MKSIKKSIMELDEYFVLQDLSVVKLNQNECNYDIPVELKQMITGKLFQDHWNRYAAMTPARLIHTISGYTGFPDSGIVVGNGSNELIQSVLLTFCEHGDKILVVSPGFSIYSRVARIMDLEIVEVPLLKDFSFDVPTIIDRARGVAMIFLASPNNPTGTALSIEEVDKIARNIEGVLVLDEAYFEFYQKTAQDLIGKYKNIVIIRTFSKAFGLAGIRLGYLLAQPEIARAIDKTKLPFSVGVFQQIAGAMVMNNHQYVQKVVDIIIDQREQVFTALKKIESVTPIPSFANFILFGIKGKTAKDVFNACYQKGVLLRHFGGQRLKNMLRVTIGTPEENQFFLKTLTAVAGD